MLLFLLLLIRFLSLADSATDKNFISGLPNLSEPMRSKQYSGYLNISDKKQLFYWYIESENKPDDDPVVLWLNGGPGCASMDGLFIEMGPFRVRNQGARVERNPWTWNRLANIIYLDSPAGVGLSYYNTTKPVFTDDQVANDTHAALVLWFKLFPERLNNKFYVAGESYGGTYVPTLSSLIISNGVFKQFEGMLIGNGCLDDEINFNSNMLYQYYHGLLDQRTFEKIRHKCCKGTIDCNYYAMSANNDTCGNMINDLSDAVYYTGLDPYFLYFSCYLDGSPDGRQSSIVRLSQHMQVNQRNRSLKKPTLRETSGVQPACAHHDDHIYYLNSKDVRSALRIPDYIQDYATCSMVVGELYVSQYDTMTPFFNNVINAKKRVTLFNGDADSICNVVQNQEFLSKLGRKQTLPATPFVDDSQLPSTIGFQTKYDGVEILTIKGGGHFPAASTQKPKETFQMFQNFLLNQNYSTQVGRDLAYSSASSLGTVFTLFVTYLVKIFMHMW